MGFVAAPVNGIVLGISESQDVVCAGRNGGIDAANHGSLIWRLRSRRGNFRRDEEKNGNDCTCCLKPPATRGLVHALNQIMLLFPVAALARRSA
jgi:hypothetical protein